MLDDIAVRPNGAMLLSLRTFMKNLFRRLRACPKVSVEAVQQTGQGRHEGWDTSEKELPSHDGTELLSMVAEAAPDMLFLFDIPSLACVYVNRQVSAALGFSKQEVETRGLSLFESILHPEDRMAFSNGLMGLSRLVDGDVCDMEYRFHHVNGEWLWFHCRVTAFRRDDNGLPRQVLCAARDVTARRQYEEAVREGEVVAALSRLAARVAHDINNPLANIRNSLFLLRTALLPDHPDTKYLQWSEEEVDRIAQAVQRIATSSYVDL